MVRDRRRALDLTQEQLAERVGCSVDLVRKVERGQRRPSREVAARLARFLALADDAVAPFVAAARAPLAQAPAPPSSPAAHTPFLVTPRPLPAPPTPLFGRAAELERLARLLADPACRLVTVLGLGGAGKTRLAIEAAGRLPPAAGVTFAPLEGLSDPALLPLAIAEAIGVPLAGAAPPAEQIVAHLRGRPILLVLDNMEHLISAADLVGALLAAAPSLRVLATSRERLGLRGEWLLAIDGLPLADGADDGALALFALHARRARGGASLTTDELQEAARICRMVEGSPLAIELAASWARALSCAEIAAEMARTLDFLSPGARDLPPRQRSPRAAFDYSWALLDGEGRNLLPRLSLFRGGFDYPAAAAVAGASHVGLAALVDRSLLRRSPGGRFALHALVREFAAERLESGPAAEGLRDAHARHYAGRLANAMGALRGPGQEAALQELLAEIENLRLAWERAVHIAAGDLIGAALKPLWYVYEIRGWYGDGEALFGAAATARERHDALWAELAAAGAWFAMRVGRTAQARAGLERCLAVARALDAPQTLATILDYLGLLELQLGALDAARPLFAESLGLHQGNGNAWGAAFATGYLGLIDGQLGALDAARPLLEGALTEMRALGDPRGTAMCLLYLGGTLAAGGVPAEAEGYLRESLALSTRVGDRWGAATATGYLGLAAMARGESEVAGGLLREAVALMRAVGDRLGEARLLALAGGAPL